MNIYRKSLINTLLSAMFIAIGLLLPFLTGQLQQIGKMLLPMHLPVFLCGLICGWQYGLIVGFVLPLLRSALFSMPVLFPSAIAMSFELATYGLVAGLIFSIEGDKYIKSIYISILSAMILGRIVWGFVMLILLGVGRDGFTISAFVSGALLDAVPGIILQLLLIPAVMLALRKSHLIHLK